MMNPFVWPVIRRGAWPLVLWTISAGFAGGEDAKTAAMPVDTKVAETKKVAAASPEAIRPSSPAKPTLPIPPAADKAARLQLRFGFRTGRANNDIENDIQDYTCSLVKRERVDGMLGGSQGMRVEDPASNARAARR